MPEAEDYPKVDRSPKGKCAECAKPLRPNVFTIYEKRDIEMSTPDYGGIHGGRTWTGKTSVAVGEEITGYGYMSQGYFCTLRCGWRFGLRVLKHDDQRRADR